MTEWLFELTEVTFRDCVLRDAEFGGATLRQVSFGGCTLAGADFAKVRETAGRISFARIVDTVARIVSEHDPSGGGVTTLEDVLAVDAWARARARELNR